MRVLITGAGGFIGSHLVESLKKDGHFVRGIDLKYPEFKSTCADDFMIADLRAYNNCSKAVSTMDWIYHLAADMGGIGYITKELASIARNNSLININMLEAARVYRIKRLLFSSSACVYPSYRQNDANVTPLAEDHAIPADPEPGYGWEKLYMEQLCEYYRKDFSIDTRIVRFHNVYGACGVYEGGKEKAPAALCRKIATSKDGVINVWGDGKQTRSFMYVDDCIEGIKRLMKSNYFKPINLGTDELVSIDDLVHIIAKIAGKDIKIVHDCGKPQGVRGRNSDNSRLREVFGWEPQIKLEHGLKITYSWIEEQVRSCTKIKKESVFVD